MGERQNHVKTFNSKDGADVYLMNRPGPAESGSTSMVPIEWWIFDFRHTPAEGAASCWQSIQNRPNQAGVRLLADRWWHLRGDNPARGRSSRWQLASRVVDKRNPIAWSKRLAEYLVDPEEPKRDNLGRYAGAGQDSRRPAGRSGPAGKNLPNHIHRHPFEVEEEEELTREEAAEAEEDDYA